MVRILPILGLLFMVNMLIAQTITFEGLPAESEKVHQSLSEQFHQAEVYQIDVRSLSDFVKNAGYSAEFDLKLGDAHYWPTSISPKDIRGRDYQTRTASGNAARAKNDNITFSGRVNLAEGGAVALTIDDDFLYGYFDEGGETYFIEPLWYFVPEKAKDLFVVYASSDVRPSGGTCGADEMHRFIEKNEGHTQPEKEENAARMLACKEVELAIASDFSMFQKYGSAGAVEVHNLAVINNVQTNYDDEFNDELQFVIVEQFVVDFSGGDPWTASNNAGTLLDSFTNWGPSGFSSSHDLGELWTNRNLSGSTIGIAWLNAACTSVRYHVLQDFSTNASLLRVLTAHEIGHNFSATHDASGSGTIMAPSVNGSNSWSANSVSQINSFVQSSFCLDGCVSSQQPFADFSFSPGEGCAPMTVLFSDESSGATEWSWSFPGGTPAFSIEQNPVVTYQFGGTFDVSLSVANSFGSNTITQPSSIIVGAAPFADFGFDVQGTTAIFQNFSSGNITEYFWEFGDGGFSQEENPFHVYDMEGFYDVDLTVSNECGSTNITLPLTIFTVPQADFTVNSNSICDGLSVTFVNESSPNATNFLWEFEGGMPASSIEENPTVVYSTPGTYSVTLAVSNPAGANTITQAEYITVGTIPTPDFNFVINGNTVTFQNTSSNIDGLGELEFFWDFGDNTTSFAENPTHTYMGNGEFTAVLTTTNGCGSISASAVVTIEVPPTASFSANSTSGCEPFTTQFNNLSSANSGTYQWSFPGGSPSTSTDENPTVTYAAPGTFDVTLIVSNNAGADTVFFQNYISVAALPTAGFTSSGNGPTYTFSNTSANATSYLWDFGDNATSTESNPVHTYTATGNFTVTLSATNDCGTQIFTQTASPVTMPTAGFSASQTSGCAPFEVQFNNQSSENTTNFQWTFPGGEPATSTSPNPMVTYNAPGNHSVTLVATNAAGSSTSSEVGYIVVNTVPNAGFTVSTNALSANFNNASTNAAGYSWDFGDNSSSADANPSHTYTEDGTYTVTLSATNDCGTDVSTQTVVITSLPLAGFSASQTSGCAPFEVQFSNQSSENSTSFDWSFPGGTPSSSTAPNTTVTYAEPGMYPVTLVAMNGVGQNTSAQTDFITVGAAPNAGFSAAANLLTVDFTNSSSTPPNSGNLSYSWDFGDSQNSAAANPAHTYVEDGTYEVVLTVSNDCGTATSTQSVTVVSLPSAGFSASQTTGCESFMVDFTNQSSENAANFLWEFPGGDPATSTEENPTVTFASAGAYTVTLTATNAAGEDESTAIDYIIVGAAPSADISIVQSLLTLEFNSLATNPANSGELTHLWDFGDNNSSTEENPTHTYAEDGFYDLSYTVTNGCGSDTFTEVVNVVSPPTANFNVSQASGCAPFTVLFTNNSSENATDYQWTFPGGEPASSTDENPTVTYSEPGEYDVILTATNSAGNNTFPQTNLITVNDVPASSFGFDLTDDLVSFTNNSTNATSFFWDFGDSQNSEAADPEHTYEEDGAYTVALTASNECGSVTSEQLVVIATQGPIAAFSAGATTGCAPFTVVFNNLSSENATGFEWDFSGGDPATSTDENPTVTYATAGIYDVSLTTSNPNGSDTFEETEYIIVDDVPTVGFTASDDMGTVAFTNTSTNATSFEWDFGDDNFSTEENPVHTYDEPKDYTVTLTATNDCGTSTMSVVVTATEPVNSLDELPGIAEFNVFPNPNGGEFSLVMKGEGQPELNLTFTNVLGQTLLNESVGFASGELHKSFTFSHLAAGTYILQVSSGDRALHRKVVVE